MVLGEMVRQATESLKYIMTERKIWGVCAWLADKFGLDVGGVRILFVAAAIFGLPVIIYLILYLVKPSEY